MAKKFVRGITDVKTINNQDFDTNNVNDLLSDGQYNYIHRKKGKNEEYHNLTDNIKTLFSDNTDLLTVTNNNKTTNTATLSPKHDAQKEQVLESTRDTVTIHHGTNGTAEKTTVDTNPQKVLEHENLISSSQYVTIEHVEDSNTSEIKTDELNNTINELNSKITTVEGKIPTSIGCRNLWIQSKAFGGFGGFKKEELPKNHITGQKVCYRINSGAEMRFNIEPDFSSRLYRKVTFSAWVKYENVVQGENIWNGFNCFKQEVVRRNSLTGDTSDTEYISLGTFTGTSDWKYITYTYDYGANKSYDQLKASLHFKLEDTKSGTAWITGIKVELGSIPSDYSPAPEDTQEQINTSLAQKQDKLTAMDGITIDGQTIDTNPQKVLEHENLLTIDGISKVTTGNTTTIGLKIIDNYSGDLNELTETCLVKPTNDAGNLPTGVGEGILTVVKIGNTVSQKYHTLENEVYTRVGTYVNGTWNWSEWTCVTPPTPID